MSKFMYLFRNSPDAYRGFSPEQMQQTMQKWLDWKAGLEKNGHTVQAGQRMDHGGKVIRGTAKAITDGPYVEVKDFVQGQMIIEAKDLDEAVKLAGGCPVLENNGSVEIRGIIG